MAELYTNWKNDTTYTFSTITSARLPDSYTNVKLSSISSYSAAVRIAGANLYSMWRQIYPSLPPGTPDAPERATWLTFESRSGETITLANDWIVGSSVVPVDFTQATVTVTDTTYADMMILRDFMTKRGMKFKIDFS